MRRSDADADVLADYVLALLRHDGDMSTVRALCEAEIPDFLKEDSAVFVQDVFDAIAYKTYAGGVIPPRRSSAPLAPPTAPSAPFYPPMGMPGAPSGPQYGSRKRSYNDRGDGDAQDRGYVAGGDPNGRSYKQPRRGGNLGRGTFDNFGNGRGGFQGLSPPLHYQGLPLTSGVPSPPPGIPTGMPSFDPNDPMAAILQMQAMGFPLPGMPTFLASDHRAGRGYPSMMQRQPKKQRCRDYDSKGFCARGNTCMYEHGQDSIYVPPVGKTDEYDPTNSTLMAGVENGNSSPGASNNIRGNDRGRGRGGFRGNSSRRGGRAEFSSDKPNFDRTKSTIVVENIPEEKFSEDEVRAFFGEYGNIIEITMRPYKRLAIVKYDDYTAALAAYKSPKVIFDNRFVKVYWYVDQESLPQPPSVQQPKGLNGGLSNGSGITTPAAARATSEPQIDIEEFAKKQQEVQKAHEEKMKKKEEMEVARKELERRQEELLKNQAEEKRKLMEKIASMSGKSSSPSGGVENGTPAPADAKVATQTETLKAQLAGLEAEAQSLGIDPSAGDDSWGGRGGFRGRVLRGGYRGRGAINPRGRGEFRGGYRGRGGAPIGGMSATYKLDNRPKTVGLKGIDFTIADNQENLRAYLLVRLTFLYHYIANHFSRDMTTSIWK